jgi:hypothetical protein
MVLDVLHGSSRGAPLCVYYLEEESPVDSICWLGRILNDAPRARTDTNYDPGHATL